MWKNLLNKERKNHGRQPIKFHYIESVYKCRRLSYDAINPSRQLIRSINLNLNYKIAIGLVRVHKIRFQPTIRVTLDDSARSTDKANEKYKNILRFERLNFHLALM
jgi:hypothetical protein